MTDSTGGPARAALRPRLVRGGGGRRGDPLGSVGRGTRARFPPRMFGTGTTSRRQGGVRGERQGPRPAGPHPPAAGARA